MTTSEVRAALTEAGVPRAFDAIVELLMTEARVEIADFGVFELHHQKGRRAQERRDEGRAVAASRLLHHTRLRGRWLAFVQSAAHQSNHGLIFID